MKIRTEQIEVFEQAAVRNFEDEMVEHLADFSPPLFKVIKQDQMRQAVRFGMSQAGQYGLTLRGPLRLYLEMMLLFGSHFDTDPQYAWAADILKHQHSVTEMARAERLYQKTLDYQEKVSGPDDANTRKALSDLSVLARSPETFSSTNFRASIRQEMIRVFPTKANYIGEEALADLIQEGLAEASKYHFSTHRGEALIVVLMFAFGHGCTKDPLYPWIARTLADEKIIDPAARAERLEKKAVTWLEHVIISSPEGPQT